MSLSLTKRWIIGGALLCVLLLVASWFLLIQPQRAEAAELREHTATVQTQNTQLETRIRQLEAQYRQLPSYRAELAAIKQAMPEDISESTLLRSVQAVADGTGVNFYSVAIEAPVLLADPAAEAAPAAAPPEGEEAAAAPAPSPSVAPAAAGPAVYKVPTNFQAQGTFVGIETFLQKLQTEMPRAMLVTGIELTAATTGQAVGGKPATSRGDVELTMSANVYVLREEGTDAAVVTSPTPATSQPAATATATVTAPATPAPSATTTP